MLGKFRIRTDLALEAHEVCEDREAHKNTQKNTQVRGVRVEETADEEREIYTTTVTIETENGAKAMGKPVGTYITIEAPNMSTPDEDYHREISEELAKHLSCLIGARNDSVLVVGLGNREVTPDALGPDVVNNLRITRHMIKEYGRMPAGMETAGEISAIAPGVMAQTGMETLEIIRGVVKETRPELVIAIDALAARSTKRLNRTIQVTDTGINPGSGVGNHRNAINGETLGVPVIAIGVPTVVDAATIVNDTMEELLAELERCDYSKWLSAIQSDKQEGVFPQRQTNECDGEPLQYHNMIVSGLGEAFGALDYIQKQEMIHELISPNLNTMFVTPKDIDESVKYLSYTISEALNIALAAEEK